MQQKLEAHISCQLIIFMFFLKQFWKNQTPVPAQYKTSFRVKSSLITKSNAKRPLKNNKAKTKNQKQNVDSNQENTQQKQQEIISQSQISPEELQMIQMKSRIKRYQQLKMNKEDVINIFSVYFKTFIEAQRYQSFKKDIGVRVYNTISKYVLRKRFVPKIEEEMSKIIKKSRFNFQRRSLFVVVKERDNSTVKLEVEEVKVNNNNQKYKKKSGLLQPFSGRRTLQKSQYKKYSNIQHYLMVDFQKKQVFTIGEYLKKKAQNTLVDLVYRMRIKMQLKTYKYKSKFTLNYFYENLVYPNFSKHQIVFFAKIFVTKGTLKLSIESISLRSVQFTIPINYPEDNDYSKLFSTFLQENYISLQQNRPLKKIFYNQHQPFLIKLQSIFRGYQRFCIYQQYKLYHPQLCKMKFDKSRQQFITFIMKENYVCLIYVSRKKQPQKTKNWKYQIRYTQIVMEQFSKINYIESRHTFIQLIVRINTRIQNGLIAQNQNYKTQLQRLKVILLKFVRKYKKKKSAKQNYHLIKIIDSQNDRILMIVRNSSFIENSYEISIYNLTSSIKYTTYTVKKQVCRKQVQTKSIEDLFYISHKDCFLMPFKQGNMEYVQGQIQRHSVIELKTILYKDQVYFYEVYQEKRIGFYLQIYKGGNQYGYRSIRKQQIDKNQLAEMNPKDIEDEVMNYIVNY